MTDRPDNHDLPSLDQLGERLQAAYAVQAEHDAQQGHQPRRRSGRRRFVVAAAASLFVLAPTTTVVAVRPWSQDSPDTRDPEARPGQSNQTQLQYSDQPRWRMSARASGTGLCFSLSSDGEQAGTCTPDVPGRAGLAGYVKPGQRDSFVFGVTSERVLTVRIEAGPVRETVKTQAPPAANVRRSGLRDDFRSFVLRTDRPLDPTVPLRMTALDEDGKVIDRFPRR